MIPQRTFQHIRLFGDGSGGDRSKPALIEQNQARREDLVARFPREQIEGSRRQHPTCGVSHERVVVSFAPARAGS